MGVVFEVDPSSGKRERERESRAMQCLLLALVCAKVREYKSIICA